MNGDMEERAPALMAGSTYKLVLTEKLKQEKEKITARLADINTALEILEKNPEIAKAMDAVSKLGRY